MNKVAKMLLLLATYPGAGTEDGIGCYEGPSLRARVMSQTCAPVSLHSMMVNLTLTVLCLNFGQCAGDYRMQHCDERDSHYFAVIMGDFACHICDRTNEVAAGAAPFVDMVKKMVDQNYHDSRN